MSDRESVIEEIANQYHLPGPTNFREALGKAWDAAISDDARDSARPCVTNCATFSDWGKSVNTLPNGTLAVGAPGSIARAQAEADDRARGQEIEAVKQLKLVKDSIMALEGLPVSYRLCVKVPDFMRELDGAIAAGERDLQD